ncbi:DUF2238 domain-containing protein [Gallaecimonas sp. GXIMD4217]|uniref:DUF2238 domain-containing protein n=1 Tax=Gallaecimonas sp. GXIMD4217 TaxID=3131927 RepID=UPI00311B32ED
MSRYFPQALLALFSVLFLWLGIDPASREVWVAEVIPVLGVVAILAFTFRAFRFSNLAYGLMAFWIFWHTVGAHFTFAHVPFDWVTDALGAERNHFDRIGHFSVGFYAFAFTELLVRRKWAGPVIASLFSLFAIMAIAAGYEIIEWWFAVVAGGDAGIEFLGSQGDIWDAQKDMLADTLGAIASLALYWLLRKPLQQK